MRKVSEEQRERLSLTLLFSVTVLIFLILTTVISEIVLITMVYRGQIQIGEVKLNISRFIFEMLLWSTGIGAILTLVTSRFPLKPVNKFLDMINRVASGDYKARLTYTGPFAQLPAVKEMTNSVNSMASQLEQTEILRNDFINDFSHEFKTPIVSIAGFARMLRHGDLTEEQQQEYLEIIEEESMRLARMSSNILDLTRVESQSILTDVQTYNLSEQMRNCVLMLERKWSKKHIEIILPEREYQITGSMELLGQVWINLLDNAIKFSEEFSSVAVGISQDSCKTSVTVSNYCEDIPPEKLSKLFNKFYQADESHTAEGNGVGLAIVKKVIDLHNGSIQIVSNHGKTEVVVSL